jgi:GNAT superfamily N-acetyltransferase
MDRSVLLKRIEDSYLKVVRTRSFLIPSGPFLISLNPGTRLRWLNNAVVADDTGPIDQAAIAEMVRVFEANDRMPRMEIFRELRSDLVDSLIANGFAIESELPTMVCTKDSFIPQRNETVSVELLTPASDPSPFMRVVDASFGHEEPITPERIEGMRQSLRKGTQWAALGRIGEVPAAVASLVVSDGVAELAGVGTVPDMRRRGAASTVSTQLLEEFFSQGEVAWLSAGDDTARAVYERLGFELLGVQVNISRLDEKGD